MKKISSKEDQRRNAVLEEELASLVTWKRERVDDSTVSVLAGLRGLFELLQGLPVMDPGVDIVAFTGLKMCDALEHALDLSAEASDPDIRGATTGAAGVKARARSFAKARSKRKK